MGSDSSDPAEAAEAPEAALGRFLKAAREANQLSRSQLAQRSGLSKSYIQKVELGRVKGPSVRTLDRLATGLRMDIVELFEGMGLMPRADQRLVTGGREVEGYLRRERSLSDQSAQDILRLVSLFELAEGRRPD